MSNSYRKPYASCCGTASAKNDKTRAARGVRRAQNAAARRMLSDPDLLMPHRLECSWNNTYSWSRDGGKRLQIPTARDWSRHVQALLDLECYGRGWAWECYLEWPPAWYAEFTRK